MNRAILQWKSILVRVTVMFVISILIIFLDKEVNPENDNRAQSKEITLWYNDIRYEKYFKTITKSFKEDTGITVKPQYISDVDYLEKIAEKSANEREDMPDIYLLNSQDLEAAYRYGIAKIEDNSIISNKNYPDTALRAVQYHGQTIAYPLSYDTVFMVYNTSYMKQAPATFDDIIDYASSYDSTLNTNIHYILKWNVKDLLYNYQFIGGYIQFGGDAGDDSKLINLNNQNVKQASSYYQNLSTIFTEDNSKDDFSWIVDSFTSGETVCALIRTEELKHLAQQNDKDEISFKVCKMPSLSKKLVTRPLSLTNVMVINLMSDKDGPAEKFAKYIAYEKSNLIISQTDLLPAKKTKYKDDNYKLIQQQYNDSAILPKMIITEDYFVRLQSTLNKIWNGEDVNSILDGLYQTYLERHE